MRHLKTVGEGGSDLKIAGLRILVTGITGTLGERVAMRFIKEAEEVRGLVRSESSIERYRQLGITPILGDLTHLSSLEVALRDIDLVIHCAAYLGENEELAISSNVIGVENLARVTLEKGVKKFIHISSTSVYGEPNYGHFTEDTPIVQTHKDPYIRTKAQSEHILRNYIEKGLNVVMLRPGAICAEENSYWGDRQVERMINAEVVDWVHPDDVVPWVHGDNLVEIIHLVLRKGECGDVYHAIDGNYCEKDYRMKLVHASGRIHRVPQRELECATFSNQRLVDLGYTPLKTFEETLMNLELMAKQLNRIKRV